MAILETGSERSSGTRVLFGLQDCRQMLQLLPLDLQTSARKIRLSQLRPLGG